LEAAVEAQSASMAAAAVRAIAGEHGGIPDDPREQLRQAIAAVFRSWRSERATLFRRKENLPDSLGTAVTVQSMVFGNLGSNSGTGVVFTRDPATGSPGPYGDYLGGAQGEDVVAGDHAVSGLGVLAADLPGVYAELTEVIGRLEHHYRDMCDVEFTVSDGILYILQTRIGRRSPLAAVRIAVAMAEEAAFPLSRAQAVARVDAATLRQLAAMGGVDTGVKPIARGLPASPGVGTGILSCDPGRAAEMTARNIAVVLARQETSPEDVHGMIGASAIITSLGGVASHAAVVARSWAIPAVTGIAGMTVRSNGIEVDGEFVAEGETVTVDGTTGSIYVGDCRQAGHADCQELITLRAWAAELGVEPGEIRAADDSPGRSADVTLFQLARTLQLKGLATPDRLALVLSAAESRIRELLESNGTVFQPTPRGFMLTPDGRAWSAEQLAAERAAADAADLASQYEAFLELNHEFKRVVSDWQVVAREASADEAWPGLVEAVSSIDAGLRPVLDGNAAQVSRLEGYGPRFRGALEAMRGGDRTMLAAPLKDSYHTVWFEYHEELIALCGRNRADEER
jgi:pyruvate,orthophosphate dikinase